jgi:hypothetical protein
VGVAEHGLALRLRGEPALRDVPIHCISKPPDRESIRTLL